MIKKLNLKFRVVKESGLFHDSRADVRTLLNASQILHDKINELVDEVNRLKGEGAK